MEQEIRDPGCRLNAALDILEKFTQLNAAEPIPHIYHQNNEQTHLGKIIALTRCFITSAFDEEVRRKLDQKRNKAEEEVWKAIDDVQRYHPLVLKQKSREGQALLARAQESISQFNHFVGRIEKNSFSWHKRFLRFMIKRSCLSISKPCKIDLTQLQKASKAVKETSILSEKIVSFQKNFPSQREEDAFRVKAITLIQNQSKLFPSIKRALSSLKESPIYTINSVDDHQNGIPANSIVTLEQKLSPFPGETIILKGAFVRNPNSLTPTIPIPESFELTLESTHTGFPHPSQHTGWGLCDSILPVKPHREEQIQDISNLLKRKNSLSLHLMRQGELSTKAKLLLLKKEACANEHHAEFLQLQKMLCISILNAAPQELHSRNHGEIIHHFFGWLEGEQGVYYTLSKIYQFLNDHFMMIPFQKLTSTWLNQENRDLLSKEPKICFLAARQTLEEVRSNINDELSTYEGFPKPVIEFILAMGQLIGKASDRLILQHLSEVMEFPPPFFTAFERKLQAAAFNQLESFLNEFENDHAEPSSFKNIKSRLLKDIELFEERTVKSPMVDMLEHYYFARFHRNGG